jgi:acetylornithine deacetylase/succinyl-diaminopimelate desuccinylase-like protein
MRKRIGVFVLFILTLIINVDSQDIILSKNEKIEALNLFKELLSLPNDAHFNQEIEKNIQWCESAFTSRRFTTKRLNTDSPIPLLLAEYDNKIPGTETVLIYLQIDGQPVDTSFWWQKNPYEATLKRVEMDGEWIAMDWDKINGELDPEWRIFARSASDAKGPVAMFLQALDIIHKKGLVIPFNVKLIMDFEEELGSPNLAKGVELNRSELAADHLIIFDGPMHPSLLPTLSFGARGITTVTLKVYGPNFPQHSGHYGNYVPNPALTLTQLIATFKDEKGRVLINGWYEGITIDEKTKKILQAVPDDEESMRVKIGFARPDAVANNYQESIQYPSLNIRGLLAGWVGSEVRTIIPSLATVEIDIRTVKESDPIDLLDKLRSHIENVGFVIIDEKPTLKEKLTHPKMVEMNYEISYQAFRTELDSPTGLWLRKAMIRKNGSEPIMKRTSGGSIPISPFVNTLGIPAVTVPTVNPDNNQHSPNENIRVGNFLDGIVTMVTILTQPIEK